MTSLPPPTTRPLFADVPIEDGGRSVPASSKVLKLSLALKVPTVSLATSVETSVSHALSIISHPSPRLSIHLLLVIAVIVLVVQLISGRRTI